IAEACASSRPTTRKRRWRGGSRYGSASRRSSRRCTASRQCPRRNARASRTSRIGTDGCSGMLESRFEGGCMATVGGGEGIRVRDAVLDAHPFLDPKLSERRPDILRFLYKQYLTMEASVEGYNQILNKLLHPAGDERSLESNLATASYYLNEAVHYIRGLLDLLPDDVHRDAFPRPEVTRCSDVLELL